MPLTKIEAVVEIPEGFEFDRVDRKTKDVDYNIKGNPIICNPTIFDCAQIILRKKPEPAKPAYRVYIDEDSNTFTADRLPSGEISQTFRDNIKWISDWIEYNPALAPKQWPTPLVERVAAIDIKAAEWIVENWDDLLDGRYTRCGLDATSNTLIGMFAWDMSIQGRKYWKEISVQLGE